MRRIHIGLNLKNKTGEGFLIGRDIPSHSSPGAWTWSYLHKGVQHLFDAEVVDSASEEDWGLIAFQIMVEVKGICSALDQFNIFSQLIGLLLLKSTEMLEPPLSSLANTATEFFIANIKAEKGSRDKRKK